METTTHAGSAAEGGRGGRRTGARKGRKGTGGAFVGRIGGQGCGAGLVNPSRAFCIPVPSAYAPLSLPGLALLVHTADTGESNKKKAESNQTGERRQGRNQYEKRRREVKGRSKTYVTFKKKKKKMRALLGLGRVLLCAFLFCFHGRAAGFEGRASVRGCSGASHRNKLDPIHVPTHFYPSIGLQRPCSKMHGPTPALRRPAPSRKIVVQFPKIPNPRATTATFSPLRS